jgi:anti-sigma regulatory factor (Ser/Thr protein kinase)
MRYYISPESIVIEAIDTGPGIPDVDAALTEGFSTASEQVRAFGFGAGMGLPNTKRVSDLFHINSKPGKNTTVRVQFNLSQEPETE